MMESKSPLFLTPLTERSITQQFSLECSVLERIYSVAKKVFSQPPIVQVLPRKMMREACNFHHMHTNYDRQNEKKNPENHIVGFLMNLFEHYGGK